MKAPLVIAACLLLATPAFAAPAPAEPGRAWTGSHKAVAALIKAGKNEEVVKAAQALLARSAKDHEAHYLRGRALFVLKRDTEAIKALSRAIEIEPNYPNPYFFRGLTHAYSKRPKLAEADFSKATQLAPRETPYWVELARNYARMGNASGAAAAMETAVKLSPQLPQGWYLLGNYSTRSGAEKRAVAAWEKAVSLSPKHIDALFNLGQSHQNQERPKRAAKYFAAILEADPNELDALKKMVQVHYQQGLYDAAQPFRSRLMKLIAASSKPRVKNMTSFCFDQFKIGKDDILANETLRKTGDLFYHYTFQWVRKGQVMKSINLESSAVIREKGIAFILGMTEGSKHSTFDRAYEKMPAYDALKKDVIAAFRGELKVVGSSGPSK